MPKIFTIDLLPAREGDCIWIEYGDSSAPHRILIDGGRKVAHAAIKDRVKALAPKSFIFDLAVLTHVDADHVEGLLSLVEDAERRLTFRDVWFNGYHHLDPENFAPGVDTVEIFGAVQGERFSRALVDLGWPWNSLYSGHPVVVPDEGDLPSKTLEGGMKITLLSPTWEALQRLKPKWEKEVKEAGLVPGIPSFEIDEEVEVFGALSGNEVENLAAISFKKDTSPANRTSIAFIAEYGGKRALFTGDAHSDVVEASLLRLQAQSGDDLEFDAFKISHHGSKGTLSHELIQMAKSPIYLISTNGSRYNHPDREAIARIAKFAVPGKQLVFNYRSKSNLPWNQTNLKTQFDYSATYPNATEDGTIRVDLL